MRYSFDTKSSFFSELKQRVSKHFVGDNIHRSGDRRILVKGVILVTVAAIIYVVLLFFTPPWFIALSLCVILGFNLALIGFNIMHDGGHKSFSKYAVVNNIAAHFLNVLGGTAHFWDVKHNVNHHTFTNIEGLDSDIDVKPFMRLHPDQPHRWYHRFQHIYWIFLYGISYVVWIFYEDFQKYFSGRINPQFPKKALTTNQHLVFWFTKLTYIFLYIVLPITLVGWLWWLIGFFVITFVCGVVISIVFQLAHVVGGTQFHRISTGNAKNDWAVHQVVSTANFETQNRILHLLLGGLNFQIEHHLFPRISHVHYPAISKYVKQACHEYGIVYNEYKTMFGAIASHLRHLYELGRPSPFAQ